MLMGGAVREPNEGSDVGETPVREQLVLVATPLGNLGDLSPRALSLFRDGRRHLLRGHPPFARPALSANDIPGGGRLESLHEHNEVAQSCNESSSGFAPANSSSSSVTPERRASRIRAVARWRRSSAAGLRGRRPRRAPRRVIAALTVSGLSTERFVMEGFVPRKAGDRARALCRAGLDEERTIVFYESPQRVDARRSASSRRGHPRSSRRRSARAHQVPRRGAARHGRGGGVASAKSRGPR